MQADESGALLREEIALYLARHGTADICKILEFALQELETAQRHFELGHFVQLRMEARALGRRMGRMGLSRPEAVATALAEVAGERRIVEAAALLERLGRILRFASRTAALMEPPAYL
ncbi:hypothetical protein [Pseudoruegeria aquimaris]|nr:hypothetical protein [Pseudoruegeria aquimaris]